MKHKIILAVTGTLAALSVIALSVIALTGAGQAAGTASPAGDHIVLNFGI
ncbi:hypothetical protein GCM10009839_87520 [Catenulispora yoronensis]|uniref:Secreted protein n=1 Tax=Catenulispora yoronensis TaxID=450799 RepID=A0ABN2VI81_9ACTN